MKNRAQIEQGLKKDLLDSLKQEINSYYGKVFEQVCKEIVFDKIKNLSKIGRFWHKDIEIDLIALNEKDKEIYLIECKWKSEVNPNEILFKLKEKTKYIDWNNKNRKEKIIIFAKSFSEKTQEALLIDLNEIKKYLD